MARMHFPDENALTNECSTYRFGTREVYLDLRLVLQSLQGGGSQTNHHGDLRSGLQDTGLPLDGQRRVLGERHGELTSCWEVDRQQWRGGSQVVVVVTEVVPQDRSGRRSGCDYLAEAHCTSASAELLYSARKPWWAREGQQGGCNSERRQEVTGCRW